MSEKGDIFRIGFVGAGQGGLALLDLLAHNPAVKVVYVADQNSHAPGMQVARANGIQTLTDLHVALKNYEADLVIEVTGKAAVLDIIRAHKKTETEVFSCRAALIFYSIIRGHLQHMVGTLQSSMNEIMVSIRKVQSSLGRIRHIAADLKMLALNATVEASRAGDQGKGFHVVASEVKNLAGSATKLADEIAVINKEILIKSTEVVTQSESMLR